MTSTQTDKKKNTVEFTRLYNNFHLIVLGSEKIETIKSQLIQIIEMLVENLIEADKNNEDIFNEFTNSKFLYELVILFKKNDRDLNLQILKSFSLLIANLSKEEHLNYFLETYFINDILTLYSDDIDNDYLYYYINFIKSLTLKINEKTIQYFFIKEINSFQMLTNMLKFYNHPDQMIRNVIKNTFLTILKLSKDYKPLLDFICSLPVLSYFNFFAYRLRDLIVTYYKKIKINKIDLINYLHDEIINDIMYIQDIFSLNIPIINFILTNTIFHYVILGQIYNSFINQNPVISLNCCFYFLILFLKYIKDETFINCLVGVLFMDNLHHRLIEQIINKTEFLQNYEADWEPEKKKNKIPFDEYITYNFNKKFILLQYKNTSIYSENKKIYKLLQDKLKKIPDLLSNEEELYKSLLKMINEIIKKKDIEKTKNYHNIISKSTGIQVGLSYHYDYKCPINVIRKTFELTKLSLSTEINKEKFLKNLIKNKFISFFDSNDENLIFLISCFLHFIFINENISKDLLSFIKFSNPNLIFKNQNINEEENIEQFKMENTTINNNKKKGSGGAKLVNENLNYSTFTQIYRWKKLTLLNKDLLSNEKLKEYFTINQIKYNYDYTSIYLKLITYPPQEVFRQNTLVLIFGILNYFLFYKNEEGIEKLLNIEIFHKNQIQKLFISIINSLLLILNKKYEVKTCCYEFLEEDLNYLNKNNNIDKMAESILNDSYILFPKEMIDSIKNYPEDFKNIKGETHKYKRSLFSLLLCYNLYCKIFDVKKIDYPTKFIETNIQQPEKINLEINGNLKNGTYQIVNDEFIFIEDENKEIINIRDISVNINEDKKTGKILNLSNLKEIIFSCENEENIINFKKKIEERIKLINDTYYNSMKLFFESLIENDKNINK